MSTETPDRQPVMLSSEMLNGYGWQRSLGRDIADLIDMLARLGWRWEIKQREGGGFIVSLWTGRGEDAGSIHGAAETLREAYGRLARFLAGAIYPPTNSVVGRAERYVEWLNKGDQRVADTLLGELVEYVRKETRA